MRRFLTRGFSSGLTVGLLMSIAADAQPAVLRTSDGLRLELSAEGQVTGCRLDGQVLPLASPGGFALIDYHEQPPAPGARPPARPVRGKLESEGAGLRFQGGVPGADLRLQAWFSAPKGCIRVDGEVQDTSGRDRAIGLRFDLPVEAAGWTWYDELEERRTIDTHSSYQRTYKCESGEGICSVYPWTALSGPHGGLSLALPVSQGPRVYVIEYDAERRSYCVTFFLGLSASAARLPQRAAFSFVLYRHDPAWGMRSAAARYFALFPQSFRKRPTYEGYLNYANLERFDPQTHRLLAAGRTLEDAGDYGEGFQFLWHLHGCYSFRMLFTDRTERPSDEEVRAFLQAKAREEAEQGVPPGAYLPVAEMIKKLVYDAEGHIRYIGDTRYFQAHDGYNRNSDRPGWGFNFRLNEDPAISDTLAAKTKQALTEYARGPDRQPFEACLTADAIEGYGANQRGLDYRPEHLRTVDFPLTFGKESRKVAIPNTIWDFHHTVWGPLSEQYRVLLYGNGSGYEQAFTLPFVDIEMFELFRTGEPAGRWERYLRAMTYHKICRTCYFRNETLPEHFERRLAYAIFPSVYAVGEGLEPGRALYRQYVPAIEALSAAGWEPIPYARTGDDNVVVERFGGYHDAALHLTLRNYAAQARDVRVTLDLKGLGVPAQQASRLVARDLLQGVGGPEPVAAEGWSVRVEANGSRAFWIGTPEQLARRALQRAEEGLRRIERAFRPELTEVNRDSLAAARRECAPPVAASSATLLAATERVQQRLDEIEPAIATRATVERTKLFQRVRADLAGVAVGLVGIRWRAPRVVAGDRDHAATVVVTLANAGHEPMTALRLKVGSPWPEVARRSICNPAPTELRPGEEASVTVRLAAPAEPERTLLPFLLQCRGETAGHTFTVDLPLDLVLTVAP